MSNDTDYLNNLQDYYAEHRVFPPYSAIGERLGLKSKSSVAALVARLKLAGFLEATPDKRLKPGPRFFERTLADSTVRAGLPHPADNSTDSLTIDEYLIDHPSRTVLVRVKGDSMIDAGIQEGDIVVVERRPSANAGDMVIAIVDNEFTLKYLARENEVSAKANAGEAGVKAQSAGRSHKGDYVLKPANPAYPIIRPKGQLEIFGVVVGMVRKYKA